MPSCLNIQIAWLRLLVLIRRVRFDVCTHVNYWITKFQLKLNFCWYCYLWTYSVCLSSKITLLIMVISLQYHSRKLKQYSSASFLHIKRILTSEFISRLQSTVILWYGERYKILKTIILCIKNDNTKKYFFKKVMSRSHLDEINSKPI